jgi:hypothetical protein
MEVVINLFCYSFAYEGNAFELPEPGPGNRSRRAEMVQQCLLAASADTADLVEGGAPEGLRSLGAVRTDGEPVRLITQPLEEIENGVAWVERERRSSRQEEAFPPGIAVGPLCDPSDCDIGNTELFEDAAGDIELPLAAVDQDQIGPGAPVAFRILFDGARETAQQNLTHHRIIIAPQAGEGQKKGPLQFPPPRAGEG